MMVREGAINRSDLTVVSLGLPVGPLRGRASLFSNFSSTQVDGCVDNDGFYTREQCTASVGNGIVSHGLLGAFTGASERKP